MTKSWENKFSNLAFVMLISTGFMFSCTNTDDTMGTGDFLPGDQGMFVTTINEDRFDIITEKVDSIVLNNLTHQAGNQSQPEYYALLGSVITPEEGQVNVNLASTVSPYYIPFLDNDKDKKDGYTEENPFGQNVKIDSAFIYLALRYSGDLNKEYDVYCYELNKNVLSLDEPIYSNFDIEKYINPTPICEGRVQNGKSVLLPVSLDYAKKFMSNNASFYKDYKAYHDAFNGFYFKTSKIYEGEILNRIDMDKSGLIIYYHNKNTKPDTLTHLVSLSHSKFDPFYYETYYIGKSAQFIDRNYDLRDPSLGVKFNTEDAQSVENKTYGYASGMAGLKTRLTVPDAIIEKLKNEIEARGGKKVVVMRASFNLPTSTESSIGLNRALPYIGAYSQYGKTTLIPDYANYKVDPIFGGVLNRSLKSYEVNLPVFVQNLLNKALTNTELKDTDKSVYIAPGRDYKEDFRVAPFENSDNRPITLTLTYSVVK